MPKTAVTTVLPDGFSSLGTSFCMSAWPNSHPGGRLLGRVRVVIRIQVITKSRKVKMKDKN